MKQRFVVQESVVTWPAPLPGQPNRTTTEPVMEVLDTIKNEVILRLIDRNEWWTAEFVARRANLEARHAAEMKEFEDSWDAAEKKRTGWFG